MSVRLHDELETIAAEMPPARLAGDVWQRGRRLRRRARLVAAGAALATVMLATLLLSVGPGLVPDRTGSPGDAANSVPARVYLPWPVQAPVDEWPAGPAAVVFQTERVSVTVARDGAYRYVRSSGLDGQLGGNALLSPDGRYIATTKNVIDLTNGNTYPHDPGTPLAWSLDGKLLIANQIASLLLISPATGLRRLLPLSGSVLGRAAFSPDGTRVAVRTTDGLASVNIADGSRNWTVPLPDLYRIAGPAAWSADGQRIAVIDTSGGDRLRYLDARTGGLVDEPPIDLPGADRPQATVRLIGVRPGGDLVVTVDGEHAMIVLVHPDGSRQVLLDPPAEVRSIDVPRNLAETGRFNGPASWPIPWPLALQYNLFFASTLVLVVPWPRLVWRYVLRRPPPPRRPRSRSRPPSRILR